MRLLSLCVIFLGLNSSQSAEVDNFTQRNAPLKDATFILNQAANRILDESITAANKNHSCDKPALYRQIKRNFRDQYQDKFTRFVHKSDLVPKRKVKIKHSIYADFNAFNSFVMGGLGVVYDSNAPVVRMHDFQIGGDKFEHFFGIGYYYFKRHYLKKQSVAQTLLFGRRTETGILGYYMTGVISYADLAANFKGMHFWNHLLNEGEDVLKFEKPMGPYVACENGKWKKIQSVDLLPYIDHAWDEAINCSLFKSQKLLDKVKDRLKLIFETTGENVSCPVSVLELNQLDKIYGPYAPQIINKKGHAVL